MTTTFTLKSESATRDSQTKMNFDSAPALESVPARINPRWLSQRKTFLGCTRKVKNDGTPNPVYSDLVSEIESAEREMARREAFEAWVKAEKRAILNQYPLRADGQIFEPGKVFFSKDRATGVVKVYLVQAAWESFVAAH